MNKPDYKLLRLEICTQYDLTQKHCLELLDRAEKLEAVYEAAKFYASIARTIHKPKMDEIDRMNRAMVEVEKAIKEVEKSEI
jgi:hypothetical protein